LLAKAFSKVVLYIDIELKYYFTT